MYLVFESCNLLAYYVTPWSESVLFLTRTNREHKY